MKRILVIIISLILVISAQAQIPYFGGINSEEKPFYVYTSLKINPNTPETTLGGYHTFMYTIYNKQKVGFNPSIAVFMDMYQYKGGLDQGWGLRTNIFNHTYYNLGLNTAAEFNTFDKYKWSYQVTGVFMNGQIGKPLSDGSSFGWVYNFWWTAYRGNTHDFDHWLEFAYFSKIGLTAMLGFTIDHSGEIKPTAGLYYGVGPCLIYAWYGKPDLYHDQDKGTITLGIDFTF